MDRKSLKIKVQIKLYNDNRDVKVSTHSVKRVGDTTKKGGTTRLKGAFI